MYIILSIVGFIIIADITWRFSSRRYLLPCPVWLSWFVEKDNPLTKANQSAVIVGHIDLKPGMNVLDVGCGPGRLTIPLARKIGEYGEVVAFDIQAGMLKQVKTKAQAAGLNNIRYLQAGVGEGMMGRNRFDVALLVQVLGEIPDREAALKEIFDSLKPGGILSITESIVDPHFQGRNTVARFAAAVGFREKAFYGNRVAFTMNLEKPSDR